MTVWFTSDLHFGHRKVAGIRGHELIGNHDMAIASNWAKTVKADDVVWVLGDISVSNPVIALDLIAQLPGRKRLVAGNHDKIHPMYRDAHRWAVEYGSVFEYVTHAARIKVCGIEVLLSHFPYTRDRDEVIRYPQWRLPDLGVPLLHGHTHSSSRISFDPLEVHVGIDAWDMTPVSDVAIAEKYLIPFAKGKVSA